MWPAFWSEGAFKIWRSRKAGCSPEPLPSGAVQPRPCRLHTEKLWHQGVEDRTQKDACENGCKPKSHPVVAALSDDQPNGRTTASEQGQASATNFGGIGKREIPRLARTRMNHA